MYLTCIKSVIYPIHEPGHLLLYYMEYFDKDYSVLHLINIVHEVFLENVCMLMFYVHGLFTFHFLFCFVCVSIILRIKVQLN